MDLSIILVSYNTKELLRDCLDSIYQNPGSLSFEVIVTDNNSTDGSPELLIKNYPQVKLIQNAANLGFAQANNIGAEHSRSEALMFLNSDTLVVDDAVEKMFRYLVRHEAVGAIGPKILNSGHEPTRSYMRFLDIKKLFLGSKYFRPFLDIDKHRIHFPVYDYSSIRQVPWLSGACLMVQRLAFEAVGGFDENYFLYLEDMDLCLQIARKGYEIVYFPPAKIVHFFGGSSTEKDIRQSEFYWDSVAHYFEKNFTPVHYLIAKLYIHFSRN